jgi:putative endonuclease
MFSDYVIENPQGRLYIGHTNDIVSRLEEHQLGFGGWTRSKGAWTLVQTEVFVTRAEAMRRERQLKSGRASQELRRRLGSARAQSVERLLPGKD